MRIVTRQAWQARPPAHQVPLAPTAIRELVFHYTAANADEQADHVNCARRVRGIQAFHMDSRGWADIAYSFIVCKHGYVFEGRGWDVRTAATGTANDWTLAACFLGDDTAGRDDVTLAGREAMLDVARAFRQRYGQHRKFSGHRDHMSTACPGDEIYKYIRSTAFLTAVATDNKARLATLRAWILARHTLGWSWARVKATANWREYKRLGGS